MIKILNRWFKTAFLVLDFASVCIIGEEDALVGGGGRAILSGIGLSGSDRDERDSNLLDTSKEAVVSNNEVEKGLAFHSVYIPKLCFCKERVRLGSCKTGLSPPVTLCY